jgi:KDO2-lipid IV(A) lauroyltransferase
VVDRGTPSRASLLGLALVSRALRALGPFRRELSALVGLGWYLSQPEEVRRRTAAHHRRAQPALSEATARRLARRSFLGYAAMVFDSIAAESLTPEQAGRRIFVRGGERLRGGGAVVAIAHFGNWDMAASGAVAAGLRVTTVMGPVVTPFFTRLVAWSRRRKGLELYTPERAARGLVRALRRGRVVSLMADVPEAGPTVVVPYCGGRVLFSAAPARLARALRRPLLPMACWRAGDGWIVDVGEPVPIAQDDDDAAIMARVAAALEPHVRRHPEQWYPFHEVYVPDAATA